MKTLFRILLIFFLNFLFFSGNASSSEKIKIGLIVPLSGEYSDIGISLVNSTRLAINKIDSSYLEIIPKDTKSNPIDALRVSKKLAEDGVKIIIGPVFNESAKYLDELNLSQIK